MTAFSRPWLVMWAITLGAGWLLPNHYYPWGSFHTDAWIATVLLIAGIAVIARSPHRFQWNGFAILALACSGIPFIQFFFGQLYFAGQAWICFAYLFAFSLALLIGSQWEAMTPDQPGDALFLAIGIGAFFCVGIQLYQWLDLAGLEIWTMDVEAGRYFANFGQPNLLATFLIWGLLACGWGVTRGYVRQPTATIGAAFLIFGVALTQSRTSLVALSGMMAAAWYWREILRPRFSLRVLFALLLYCFFCYALMPTLSLILQVGTVPNIAERALFSSRIVAYEFFLDAVRQSPWIGYGWSNLPAAQFLVGVDKPPLGLFAQSHNLFLDLVLWCGLPIGGFVTVYVCLWLLRSFQGIKRDSEFISMMLIAAVGFHAMLEFPLHYAHFLLPTGLMAGVISKKFGIHLMTKSRKIMLAMLLGIGATTLTLLISDYAEVEQNFEAFRFETARIGTQPPKGPPEVIVLTQFPALMKLARMEPGSNLDKDELTWMDHVAIVYSSPANMLKVAKAYARSGQPDAAKLWMRRMEKILSEKDLAPVKKNWEQTMEKSDEPAFAWPDFESQVPR